ncbi:hypothetical protein QJS10_CPA06g02122 [Acorus calamus]|uniref:Protein MIZU-KUSSEI 1-like n=1 Tax=Acorus calamus TaxID=4465 RepID=A0AAV9EIT7_ACOCL|nr:hypothetical protein QJS10_CPA06g02122 [Acorus calamus]
MDTPGLVSLLRHTTTTPSSTSNVGKRSSKLNVFRMFKLFPLLTSGCKVITLLGKPNKALLSHHGTTVTLFGFRKSRLSLLIQDDPYSPSPAFLIELPIPTNAFHKEMASGLVRIALESETRTNKKRLLEEFVWAVYCNGRKSGYSIRRKNASDDERYVMRMLRGVSMGAGVLPCPEGESSVVDGELTYLRARFEKVVGSKDSESLYMINPDGGGSGPELSIFFVRVK